MVSALYAGPLSAGYGGRRAGSSGSGGGESLAIGYTNRDEVVDLGKPYEGGASNGIAVPEHMEARTTDDLGASGDELGRRIVDIAAGSGIMHVTRDGTIPGYEVVDSRTRAMLVQVENSSKNEEPIAFTAWKPHSMFTTYEVRFLDDSKGATGGPKKLSAIARARLEEARRLSRFSRRPLSIREDGDPEKGAREWLEARDTAEVWLPRG